MIDHISLHVTDFAKAKEFYSRALKPLGYEVAMEFAEWSVAGFKSGEKTDFWIKADGAKQPTHLAFGATNKEMVDAFYEAAMAAGATDNGKPGPRTEYHEGYYGAFVLDPDGHNIEAVCHNVAPESQ